MLRKNNNYIHYIISDFYHCIKNFRHVIASTAKQSQETSACHCEQSQKIIACHCEAERSEAEAISCKKTLPKQIASVVTLPRNDMAHKPAVTLIETLISLTIIGIALVALLPVVTVRKASTVKDYGNLYWDNTKHFNDAGANPVYLQPKNDSRDGISIGQGDVKPQVTPAGVAAQDSYFAIFNQGLGNINNFPLDVTKRLKWNDTTIKNAGVNTLHIAGDVTVAAITYTDSNNLYLNDITTLILEQHATGYYGLAQTNNETYTMNKDYLDSSNNLIGNNLTTINMNNDEYLHVYNGTQIGIGKNAVRKIKNTDNIIVIANVWQDSANNHSYQFSANCDEAKISGATNQKGSNPCIDPDIVIGAKEVEDSEKFTNFYHTPTDWVIHHSSTTNFTINAPTVSFPSINAAKVILPSDRRLKTVISDYKKGLKEILKLNPVEFVYKNDVEQKHHIGVIAQDLQKVFPEAVEKNSKTGYLMVGTTPIFYALVNSIKELNLQNHELKYKNDELEIKVAKLRKIRDDLKASQGGAK